MCNMINITNTHCVPAQSCPTLCHPIGCSLPGSSVHGSSGKNTGAGGQFLLQGIFPTRDQTLIWISCIAGRIFTTEPLGKSWLTLLCILRKHAKSLQSCPTLCNPNPPGSSVHGIFSDKNIGVGCHALLQGIFPTQVLNPPLIISPALAGGFFTSSATWEAHVLYTDIKNVKRLNPKSSHHKVLFCFF